MHEASLIKNILEEAERACRDNGSLPIEKITVEISEFGGLDEEHFRFHFNEEAKSALWHNVALEIKKTPLGHEARLVSITLKENA